MKFFLLFKRNQISLFLGVCLFLSSTLLYAAEITVDGKVKSADDGQGMPGVSVTVKGSTKGTITDINGTYSINLSGNEILVFSYIGYTSQEINVANRSKIDVTLSVDPSSLDELVVVGYGTQKKSHLTGAISKLEGGTIAAIQANRVDDALAGKLGGVRIQNQSGEPGADPKIQIRAASSLSGDSNPLIVVDGFPISGSLATKS